MLRSISADLNMYFFCIALSLFYSVNSLTEVNISSITTTTTSPPTSTKALTTARSTLAIEKIKTVTIASTEVPITGTGRKELELNRKENLLKLLNKPTVIGSTCNKTDDCNTQKNSVCVNGICQCTTDFVRSPNNRTCLLKAKVLEDACLENIQCDSIYGVSGLAVCVSFRCVCSANAVLLNNNCYRKTVLGKPCRGDNECSSIQYSYCYQGVCACDPDFSPDESGTQCYPSSNGTSDMTNIDCKASSLLCKVLGEHAYCSNDTCVCYPGYHLDQKLCVPEKSLGEFCDSDSDCEVDMRPKEKPGVRECKKNKCVCIKGYQGIPEHNICQSGSSIINGSLVLILGSLFLLLK